ncbi:hypothetical protein BS47DRAFT_373421 [Hydnum rufescens UP504]|uniref:Nucleoplasmin-like domain-containing protein n=1 Tax=Hydnum rufescens UP504 TaxID=1448309 RepID=A0A9P6DY49_9AGAM|nr:hypothetical protein BS47DRAFT_373421 [Hydnum rufescens UP504]
MSVAVAVWTLTAQPGKSEAIRFPKDVKISLVTLGETLVDQERSSVKLHVSDEDGDEAEKQSFVLANFVPGKIEAQTVDLIIGENEILEVEVTGKNTVHLTGNYIDQPSIGDDLTDSQDDESAYRLEDVSSDVEMIADDFGDDDDEDEEIETGRIEEVIEEPKPASAKRPRDSTATEGGKPEGNTPKKHKPKHNKGGEAGAPKANKSQEPKSPFPAGKSDGKPESKPANKQSQQQPKPVSANGAPGQGNPSKKDKKKNKSKNKEQQKP